MISAAQLRAARGLLDWTRAELAKAAGISPETIKNIEHGTFKPQEATSGALIRAFAFHDVEFTEYDGVRKRKELVKTFTGDNGFRNFLDDIYETVRDKGCPTYQCNFSDDLFTKHTGDFSKEHVDRMSKLPNASVKCLTRSNDYNFIANIYCEYRWLAKQHEQTVPYYLYDDNVALLVASSDNSIGFVVVCSSLLAATYRQHFEQTWGEAIIPPKNK